MTIAEKYSKVLEISKKKVYKAEDECGFGRNTIANALKDNRLLSEEYHNKFITKFNVNPEWWETGKGEVILKKPYTGNNSSDSNGKGKSELDIRAHTYADLIEKNTDYKLMPTMILTDYSIIPKRILDGHEKEISRQESLINKYEGLIDRLEKEIATLRSQLVPQHAQQKL